MLLTAAFAILAACSTDRDPNDLFAPGDVGTIVVDAALIVDEPLPGIFLTRALSPGEPYSLARAALPGAAVMIRFENDTVNYAESGRPAGFYAPQRVLFVRPGVTYTLEVVSAQGERVSAVTTAPPRFKIDEWVLLDDAGDKVRRRLKTFDDVVPKDSVYYAAENQLVYTDGLIEARLTPNAVVPGYQVGVLSIDLDSDFVIDPEFFEPEDFADLERSLSSPVFEARDGTLRLPWFAIYFQERYKMRVYALDRNWYDLVRSTPDGGGFGVGGEIGDNYERPIFNIDGGIGLFGSASVDSIGVYILPRP